MRNWARLTGQLQRVCEELACEARTCAARDRAEMQSLIDCHLAERRALDRELAFLEAQHALEGEFLKREAALRGPVYQPDPRQPLGRRALHAKPAQTQPRADFEPYLGQTSPFQPD